VQWVANIPRGVSPPRRAVSPETYTGPPRYPAVPRWGFPNLTWRPPTAVPGTPSDETRPLQRLRLLGRNALGLLWSVMVLAIISAGAEIWRYVLLAESRSSALTTRVVAASDALVLTASLLTSAFALIAVAATLWWLYVARLAAAEESGQAPPRGFGQVLAGVLIPVLNLVMAGSVVAELEHAVLRRPADRRPHPSRLVLGWWAAWLGNWVLFALTVWWRFRPGVQAKADGVVLHAFTDLTAAGLALLSLLLVQRVTLLLAPIDEEDLRPRRVLKVSGAPAPELRKVRPAGAVR
jgi:hypothetical protein